MSGDRKILAIYQEASLDKEFGNSLKKIRKAANLPMAGVNDPTESNRLKNEVFTKIESKSSDFTKALNCFTKQLNLLKLPYNSEWILWEYVISNGKFIKKDKASSYSKYHAGFLINSDSFDDEKNLLRDLIKSRNYVALVIHRAASPDDVKGLLKEWEKDFEDSVDKSPSKESRYRFAPMRERNNKIFELSKFKKKELETRVQDKSKIFISKASVIAYLLQNEYTGLTAKTVENVIKDMRKQKKGEITLTKLGVL